MTILIFYSVLLAFWLENSFFVNPGRSLGLSMGLSLKNLSLFLLLFAWLIACKKQGRLWHRVSLNKYLLAFMYVMLLSIPLKFLEYDVAKLMIIGEFVGIKHFIEAWLIFIIILHILSEKRVCQLALYGLLVLMIVSVITAIFQKYSGYDLGMYHPRYYAHRGRIAGFGEANQYAGFLVLLLPLPLSLVVFQQNVREKLIPLFFFSVGMLGLIATVSRGGYLSFCLSVLIFVLLSRKYRLIRGDRAVLMLIFLPVVISVAYFLAPSGSKKRIQERVLMSEKDQVMQERFYDDGRWHGERVLDKYTSGRFSKMQKGISLFLEKPILGHGNDAAERLFGFSTHNDYLQILVNYGVIGFFVWIIIYLKLFHYFYVRLKLTSQMSIKIACLGYICGLGGYMLAMAAVNMIVTRYLFWIYTAVMYRYVED